MIIDWLNKKFRQYKKHEQQVIDNKNLYKAKKHALLALAYWKDCDEKSDLHFQIDGTHTYIRLGK